MRLPVLLAVLVGLAVVLPVRADPGNGPDLAAIRAEQVELRALADAGEDPFDSMQTAARRTLVDRQTKLLRLLEGRESFDELRDPGQVEVINLLQEINTIINAVEANEEFRCEHVRKVGSHRKERVCKTVATRKIESEASREALRRMQRSGPLLPNN